MDARQERQGHQAISSLITFPETAAVLKSRSAVATSFDHGSAAEFRTAHDERVFE